MKRITTDEPSGMSENMRNRVFGKDNEVWLRCLGDNEEDISLVNYCRKEYNRLYEDNLDGTWTAENFGELMDDDSLLSIFYWACVGFAETRQRLMVYENADPLLEG